MPLFWIDHKRKGQKPKPWQKLVSRSQRVSGMNINFMKEWTCFALQYMKRGDVLVLDRLSCHLSNSVKELFHQKGVILKFLPPKGSLLMSPLDREFFGLFTKMY